MKILLTCPPMLGMVDHFRPIFERAGVALTAPRVVQTLTVDELLKLVPEHDGWIIGDDPANREVFVAGKAGRLKAAVKWGIGVDNVDFAACRELGIPISNTPNMFGAEVADVAMCYLLGLARETFLIDRGIRAGQWPKPRGISTVGRTVGLIGLGDIGRHVAKRVLAHEMNVIAWDPGVQHLPSELKAVQLASWPDRASQCDFLVFTCSLNKNNYQMLNAQVLGGTKLGVRVVNVARGPLIDESALIAALQSGHVHSAALDVFEVEPLPMGSPLRSMERCIFGSHNSSNTTDGVIRASERAIQLLFSALGIAVPVVK